MTEHSEPTTAAGRALAEALHKAGIRCNPNMVYCRASHKGHAARLLAALPAPPPAEPALDVERLARAISAAMAAVPWPGEAGRITFGGMTYNAAAHAIAAEYARLSAQPEAQP